MFTVNLMSEIVFTHESFLKQKVIINCEEVLLLDKVLKQ